ncbi:HAAS signaling domain-containing protein [Sanguibacter suaedae]|uniref:Uncharacterized protein n=1 Tax=Sanguibacter suaedae TaxID=2795737 RepID=A0A934MDC6_9MICO|nr:hypothetical protein [Sanguibacter suaedae]MBI9114689.1 hypothetical protein [Sanguibacter suaedae]
MSAAVLPDHVSAYASEVRRHLADLPHEHVDDLTDGLEADLTEAVADAAGAEGDAAAVDLAARFGHPEEYAAELRAAAGLPERRPDEAAGRPTGGRVRRSVRSMMDDVESAVEEMTNQVWWPWVRDLALALRPVWWVARGWVLFNCVAVVLGLGGGPVPVVLPADPFGLLVLVVLVLTSVQLGRGEWRLPARARWVMVVVSAVAAVVLLPMLVAAGSARTDVRIEEIYSQASPDDGVYRDGEPVRNLFVYDADGEPVDGARILDDAGRPVEVERGEGYDPETDVTTYLEPRLDASGREVWNAYPLWSWTSDEGTWDDDLGIVRPEEGAAPPALPVPRLAPLPAPDVDAGDDSGDEAP